MHHALPSISGEIDISLRTNKVAMEKMTIINTFGPGLINGRCTGYRQDDQS